MTKCAICGDKETKPDYVSNGEISIRGYLCRRCMGLVHLADAKTLKSAAEYLEDYRKRMEDNIQLAGQMELSDYLN